MTELEAKAEAVRLASIDLDIATGELDVLNKRFQEQNRRVSECRAKYFAAQADLLDFVRGSK